MKFKSSSAYEVLRSTGVLTLPSSQTLYDYSHCIRSASGFQAEVNEQLCKEACLEKEQNKYVVLLDDLVFDKHNCKLVGFTDLGSINNILTDFDQECNALLMQMHLLMEPK